MIALLFVLLLSAHALLHLRSAAQAFGFAELPYLTRHLSVRLGWLWLAAAVAVGTTVALLYLLPHVWWIAGIVALILSQSAIIASWPDTRAGTLLNVVLLCGIVFGYLHDGPASLAQSYVREAEAILERTQVSAPLQEQDLASLPPIVQQYVRNSGAVGKPRIRNFRARVTGRIRRGPSSPWMPFTGEQVNGYGPPARVFLMDASLSGIPFVFYHRYVGGEATMRVKFASLVSMVDARGATMNRAETVTLLNDMCVLAPGAIPLSGVRFDAVDSLHVRAEFTNGGKTVHANLNFTPQGDLVNVVSDDRPMLSSDGKTFTPTRWATPVGDYRTFGGYRVASRGRGIWHAATGAYEYIDFQVTDIQYNATGRD